MVWSNPRIRKLTREFVSVADGVYMLYPEDAGNLNRVKNNEDHQFFKRFGESMPPGDWHHPGTKQGIYMIGPDGEYLEGCFAASGAPDDVAGRLKRALQRWETLRKEKDYANEPVPFVKTMLPHELTSAEFLLRVHARDLPRGDRKQMRFSPREHLSGRWDEFMQWAWNENWHDTPDWRALLPAAGKDAKSVDEDFVSWLVCNALVDNVRGQANPWEERAVQKAELTVQRVGTQAGKVKLVYRGMVNLEQDNRTLQMKLYGEGLFDKKANDLVKFELLASGMRAGSQRFNQRWTDMGPAPIGFAITRWLPEPAAKK
ncbi:MAG: hypothetical protein AB8H80_05655 [Planctomycetota bacterium]